YNLFGGAADGSQTRDICRNLGTQPRVTGRVFGVLEYPRRRSAGVPNQQLAPQSRREVLAIGNSWSKTDDSRHARRPWEIVIQRGSVAGELHARFLAGRDAWFEARRQQRIRQFPADEGAGSMAGFQIGFGDQLLPCLGGSAAGNAEACGQ